MLPGPGGGAGYNKSHEGKPNATASGTVVRGCWELKRPRPVRTECCDGIRPDVSNLTNLSLVMGAGLVNFGPVIYA
jgi:hypothetical protein